MTVATRPACICPDLSCNNRVHDRCCDSRRENDTCPIARTASHTAIVNLQQLRLLRNAIRIEK